MPKETKPTVNEILNLLPENQREIAKALNELATELDLKTDTQITRRGRYKLIYSLKKPKRALLRFETTKDSFRVKGNLFNINEYSDKAHAASETIRDYIKATRTCTSCNEKCKKGAKFMLDDKKYYSCIGSGHLFKEKMTMDDWAYLKELLIEESKI